MSSAATRLQHTKVAHPPTRTFGLGSKHKAVFCLLLFGVTLAFYNPVAHDGFILLDDVPYILGNPPVRAGLTWETVKWSFTSVHAGYWHPLTWLSHALDCQLFGLNPTGHHYVSLLFHAANAILLFLVLQEATALLWPSLLVAALFAVHPVNVESIAWAAERKNVLSMFFFLLALWAYGRYARRGGVGRYTIVAALFAAGLMAKPQIITLPFVLLLWDYWPLDRTFAKGLTGDSSARSPRSLGFLVAEKLPLLAIALVGSIITVWAQRSADAVRSLSEFSLQVRLENALVSYARYLKNLFLPTHLSPLYPHPGNSLKFWQVMVSALVLALFTALIFRWKRRRYLAVGWLWFLGILVPMIGIVQVGEQAMADRFEYIPMIGIAIALVWVIFDISVEKKVQTKLWITPAALVVVVLGVLTYHQLGYWKDGITLFRYTLSVTEKNYLAHQALGMALDKENRVEEAIPEFRAAEALHEFPPAQVLNLGIYEQRNGHFQGAIELYEKVLRSSADSQLRANAWSQIASGNLQIKNFSQAEQSYENALQIVPNDSAALIGSGLLAERIGESGRAVAQLSHAVKAEPSDFGFLLLAEALRRDRRPQEAQAAENLARKISPDFSRAQQNASQTQLFFGCTPRQNISAP